MILSSPLFLISTIKCNRNLGVFFYSVYGIEFVPRVLAKAIVSYFITVFNVDLKVVFQSFVISKFTAILQE